MSFIPRQPELRPLSSVPRDARYHGLRVLHFQADEDAKVAYEQNLYRFQHERAEYTPLRAIVALKGVVGLGRTGRERLVADVHPTLKTFVDLVRYDPSHPPPDDYHALEMQRAHERTQSDFRGRKAKNKEDFRNYLLEGVEGNRTVYLPTITGWQSRRVFDKTVFVAFDESDANAMYGELYLPKSPVMQADGQTQTAALFAVAHSADAVRRDVLDNLTVSLEIELNVGEQAAGQSFADRNGRGTKKNRNLVIALDTSSALSNLRARAVEGTLFERRLADGRTARPTETRTEHVVDLSTMEQMLLGALTGGAKKGEHVKHYHVETLLPYARDFLEMLEELFAGDWETPVPQGGDPYRRVFVHGWPFGLKGIALAYYESRVNELGPIAEALSARDASLTSEEAFEQAIDEARRTWRREPRVSYSELRRRLSEIDWHRHRAHWISLTGYRIKDGQKRTVKLNAEPTPVVAAQAQNTTYNISAVRDKVLSDSWEDLTATKDEPLPRA